METIIILMPNTGHLCPNVKMAGLKPHASAKTLSMWFSHVANLEGLTNSDPKVTNITHPGGADSSWNLGCLALKGLGIKCYKLKSPPSSRTPLKA